MKVLALDFDGTITKKSKYPIMGDLRPEIPKFLNDMKNEGYVIVLNTCRKGQYLKEAVQLLKESNVYNLFDWNYLNDGSKKGDSGKLVASFYLDDRACFVDLDDKKVWPYLPDMIERQVRLLEGF